MEEEKKDKVSKEEKDVVELTEVVTETGLAFKLPDGKIVNSDEYLVWLGNTLWDIKKALA
ncbi:MAG TPA: hypothetical protein ENG87_05060 [Candidatus Pacearchaeota archaeon]|nr:hypothetical protein [Candidatus Pacearchaeota archaeon]